jgi:phytoene synthase
MYRGFGEAWAGFLKNAHEGMATPVALPVWTVLLGGAHVLPPVLVAAALAGYGPLWPPLLALGPLARPAPRDHAADAREPVGRAAAPARGRHRARDPVDGPGEGAARAAAGVEGPRLRPAPRRGRRGAVSVALASTKTAATENFPVASLLLAPGLRSPVLAFYRFARAADDVADAPDLPPAEKLRRLDALETALIAGDPAEPAAAALHRADRERGGGAGCAQARLLLDAFRQDAVKRRYADWGELLDYCRRSANPVGRFLLALHDEARVRRGPGRRALHRAPGPEPPPGPRRRPGAARPGLPAPALAGAGRGGGALLRARRRRGQAADPRRRARPSRRAAGRGGRDAGAAAQLPPRRPGGRHDRLRARAEPPAAAVRPDRRAGGAPPGRGRRGARRGASPGRRGPAGRSDAAITRAVLRRSGSSFRLGIASLEGERRRGMHALYAYCRAVDDIADGAAPAAERRRFLDGWRLELDRIDEGGGAAPRTPVGRELAWAARRFALPTAEFRLLLDGMLTDAADRVRLADDGDLERYGRAVAGTVGLLSVRIFGAGDADRFALHLALALQLVNILRDVGEDAARDRVYVPRSRLAALGVAAADGVAARDVVADPRFGQAWADLAGWAEAAFAAAEAALAGLDRRRLLPALLMLRSYRPLLDRLRRDGWRPEAPRARLGRAERARLAWMALRGTA